MPGIVYFQEVPVYRLSEEEYNKQIDSHVKKVIEETRYGHALYADYMRAEDQKNPSSLISYQNSIVRAYGGAWRYNEIIGFIRLHFLGTQVRGEYYATERKRIVRTRRKQFSYQTWKLAAEEDFYGEISSKSIYLAIMRYIEACRREVKGRYIDDYLIKQIGPYVDWLALWNESRA